MDIHAYSCPFFRSDDGQPNVSACLFLLGIWLSIFHILAHSGAAITVPFLTRSNVKFHHAIGTASAIGFPIALAGAAGYIVNGLHVSGLPAYSLGFTYFSWMHAKIAVL